MELKMDSALGFSISVICDQEFLGAQAKTSVGKPRKFVSFSSVIAFFSATRREAWLSGWISEMTRFQFQFFKRVIAHRPRGFSCQSAVPIAGSSRYPISISFNLVHHLAKKSAIADQPFFHAHDHCELTRQSGAGRRDHPIEEKALGFFTAKSTARKSHEICVCHQDRKSVEVCFHEIA